jgi:GAF domain-containing protein
MPPLRRAKHPVTDISEEKFFLLNELTSLITITDNVGAIANLILDIVAKYTDSGKCSLMLLNERGELQIHAARGMDIHLIRNYRVKPGEGIVGSVAKNLQPIMVDDIDRDQRFNSMKRDCYTTKSFISCPVVSKNRLIGVLNASNKRCANAFSDDDFTLVKIIAQQTAIALENAFLLNQLRGKAAELEDMNRKLMDSDVVKTEFLTRISHELRTPLNSIKGSVYYLENTEKLKRSEQKEFYSIIDNETDKLTAIVENQLHFLKFDDETRSLEKSVINLSDILKEITSSKLLSTLFARKSLTLNIKMGKDIPDVVGDKIKIAQMLFNLLDGLVFYLERNQGIRLNVTENDFVQLEIAVNSKLPDDVLSVFYQQGYPFQEEGRDEKVKIYLARKVAENHGWQIMAKNIDNGFVISIAIPKCNRQKIDAAVGKSIDLFLEFISELMSLDICSVMLSDELTGELRIQSAMGLTNDIIKRTSIRPGDQICGWVALEGKPLLIENIENDQRFVKGNVPQYNTKSLLSVPLKIGDRVVGVLNLNNKKSAEPFTNHDLQLATMLGSRISGLIEKFKNNNFWEDGFREFTASFDNLLNAGKKYYKKKVLFRNLVGEMMEKLNTTAEEKNLAVYVSTVYDLGLMLMGDVVHSKKKLSPSEITALKIHPFTTVELLSCFEISKDVKQAILHHHERYDGGGYPDGLKGKEIPLISRVIAVVDGYYAMTSNRSYRNKLTEADALQQIRISSGSCYDPSVVIALEKVLKNT